MKKRLLLLLAVSQLLGMATSQTISAQSQEEFEALQEQVNKLQVEVDLLKQILGSGQANSNSNESSSSVASQVDGVIISEHLPLSLEEGYKYELDNSDTITIANLRYTKTHMALDIRFNTRLTITDLFDDVQAKYTHSINITQNDKVLPLDINQVPKELITSNYNMLTMDSKLVKGDNDFTLYFKFNEPINQSTKILINLRNNESLEVELVEDPNLI